jgi:transcriptional regulator with XRE-family HTH domain
MKGSLPEGDTSINERILEIRKAKGLTQKEFAERIQVSATLIGSIEEKRRVVKDRVIALVSMKFQANENWIRTGQGKMFDRLQNERLERIIHNFKRLDENSQDFILGHLDLLLELRKKEGKE